MTASDLCLFGDLEGVIHLDAKVLDRRLQLGMPEQQLHGAEILGATVDQCRLGASNRRGAVVSSVQAQFLDPVPKNSGVLTGPEMRRVVEPAGKQEVFRAGT